MQVHFNSKTADDSPWTWCPVDDQFAHLTHPVDEPFAHLTNLTHLSDDPFDPIDDPFSTNQWRI